MAVDELLIAVRVDTADVQTKLSKVEDGLNKVRDGGKKSAGDLSAAFTSLGKVSEIVLGVSVAGLALKAADAMRQFAVDSVSQAVKFERSLQALDVQTGRTSEALLGELRGATRGMVSDFDLAASASKALALGLDKSILPGLAATSQALGKLTGLGAGKAFDDIVTGISRGSAMILDNLGIVIDADAIYKDYAKAHGIAAESIDKHTKAQILSNEVIKNAAPLVAAMAIQQETLADRVDQAKASFSNFMTEVGNTLIYDLQAMFTNINELNEALEKSEGFQQAKASVNQFSDAILQSNNNVKDLVSELRGAQGEMQDMLGGGSKTKEERDAQMKLNRLQAEFLHMKNDGSEASKMAISVKQNEIQRARDEINILRADKLVAIDQERVALENKGIIEKDYIGNNLRDFVASMDKQGKLIGSIQNGIDMEQLSQERLNAHLKNATTEYEKQKALVTQINEQKLRDAAGYSSVSPEEQAKTQERQKITSKGNSNSGAMVKFGNTMIVATKKKKNDFVMRPGQAAEEFSADDTLIGVKNPAALFGGKGGGGINVTIGAIYGINAAEISRELRYRLQDVIPVN